jgi:pilus assembly protein CpaB
MLLGVVGLAVLATVLATAEMGKHERDYQLRIRAYDESEKATGTVVYVIKDVQEGQTISSDALEEKKIQLRRIPQDAIASAGLAVGRIAKYGVAQGQILSARDLAPPAAAAGFEARLKPGQRAVTFAVDTNSGVAGFITPESRIDIMGIVGAGGETKVGAILSDVEVIAIGQTYRKAPGTTNAVPVSSITVAVGPEQAQKLIKAIAASKIYVSLRSGADSKPVPTVDITALYGKPAGPASDFAPEPRLQIPAAPVFSQARHDPAPAVAPPEQPAPDTHDIETWAGNKRDVVSLLAPNKPAK